MTNADSNIPTPWHLWVVGGLFFLMNAPVAFGFVATLLRFEPYLAQFPEDVLSYYETAPLWMYAMWGVSIIGGVVAAILLLLRKGIAAPVCAIAWVCSLLAAIYSVVNPVPGGASHVVTAVVMVIALLVVFYMYWLKRRGVLR